MITGSFSAVTVGWFLVATGISGLLGLVFIILFFTVGQPFGTLNDISIGLTAVFSAILVWSLHPIVQLRQSSILSQTLLLFALVGVFLVLIGSYRAISEISGWYLSGLYMAGGNALMGIWLLYINIIAYQNAVWQPVLAILGIVSGGVLLLGLAGIPGIFRGTDLKTYDITMINVMWWTSALGWLALYPIWCLLLGLTLLK